VAIVKRLYDARMATLDWFIDYEFIAWKEANITTSPVMQRAQELKTVLEAVESHMRIEENFEKRLVLVQLEVARSKISLQTGEQLGNFNRRFMEQQRVLMERRKWSNEFIAHKKLGVLPLNIMGALLDSLTTEFEAARIASPKFNEKWLAFVKSQELELSLRPRMNDLAARMGQAPALGLSDVREFSVAVKAWREAYASSQRLLKAVVDNFIEAL
jgi:hypothetical protein